MRDGNNTKGGGYKVRLTNVILSDVNTFDARS